MNYIIDKDYIILINNEIIESSFKSYINRLCIKSLSTLEGRVKATRKMLDIKYNIPIYVNKTTLLFKVYSGDDKLWINYHNIELIEYYKDKVIIVFKDMERIDIYSRGTIVKKYIQICTKMQQMFNT